MLFANDRECLGAAEARHRVVRDDQIPIGFVELAAKALSRIHAVREDVVTGALQRVLNQGRIVFSVFNLQKP